MLMRVYNDTDVTSRVDLLVFLDVDDAVLFVSQSLHWVQSDREREGHKGQVEQMCGSLESSRGYT